MYKSKLTIKQTQKAIKFLKDRFEYLLSQKLNLDRVSAPLFVETNKGINDDLGVKDSALKFELPTSNINVEIIQSLAKWKRIALNKYGYVKGEGIYTDMNAIRPLDVTDQLHSHYVDQWDWELVIGEEDRNTLFLHDIVQKIIDSIFDIDNELVDRFPQLELKINKNVFFITAEELLAMYPHLDEKQRENEITKIYRTVFIEKIGYPLKDNTLHSLRAFDYDDWSLNGDILLWSNTLNTAVEISSMGIRVNEKSLQKQYESLNIRPVLSYYHNLILENKLPLTIGGGIGQSRLCLLLLEKFHIAEVQASTWNSLDHDFFNKHNITPL